jgi:hypothetical protein
MRLLWLFWTGTLLGQPSVAASFHQEEMPRSGDPAVESGSGFRNLASAAAGLRAMPGGLILSERMGRRTWRGGGPW